MFGALDGLGPLLEEGADQGQAGDRGLPRDRQGEFAPAIVPKGRRRLPQIDEMVLSLYARGMTTRAIAAHLKEVYGAEASPALISSITDVSPTRSQRGRNRPVDEVYPILYIDALSVKVRDGGMVINKSAHLVIGVDADGIKNVLGIWPERGICPSVDISRDIGGDRAAPDRLLRGTARRTLGSICRTHDLQ